MSAAEHAAQQSETVRKHKEFLFPAVTTYYQEPLALVRGEGFHVWDDRGDKYLDCFGGVLTVSVGHANPVFTKRSSISSRPSAILRRSIQISRSPISRRSWRRSLRVV